MATPSSRSINYDAVLSLCLEYTKDDLVDNIFTSAPFLSALYGAFGTKKRAGKGIRMQNGGERVRVPIMYGKNSTVGSYAGYDTLDVTPQDGITTAFFDWRQIAGSIAISRKEERQNAGSTAIRDLLQAKIDQLKFTLRDEINNQVIGKTVASSVWSAGAGIGNQTANADIDPLLAFISKDPSQSVSIGNINKNTYSWWRTISVDGSAAHGAKDANANRGFNCNSFVNLKAAARWLYNSLSRGGGGAPDIGLMDQMCFESYEASLDDKTRYMNDTSGPVTLGFDAIKFKNQDLIWDEMVPDVDGGLTYDSASWGTSTWMMINTNFMELVVDSGTDFITTPFMRPENQDAKVAQILAMMNLTCSNLRKQGMIYGITAGITS